ncbi:MAG TPA: ATP-binding protein [Pseudomonadales bacterium]
MSISLAQLLLLGLGFLSLLFLAAYISERGLLPSKLTHHPAIYTLSLGVYASAWAVYGSVGFAHQYGFNFLSYYLGITGTFLLAPFLLMPLLRLSQTYHLTSLADLLAYRYRSQLLAAIATLLMLAAVLPLLALEIEAITGAISVLNPQADKNTFALAFCALMILFTVLFGTRHTTERYRKREGLVIAIALSSIIKLIAMLAVGLFALYGVFDGPANLDTWLKATPDALNLMYAPLKQGPWRSLILAFFAAAIVMPHMYHMTFAENTSPKHLLTASWGVPLFLLAIAIAVPPILWAGLKLNLDLDLDPEYFIVGIGMASGSKSMAILAYIGGLSAASGLIIVTTLALSSMILNHIVLTLYQPTPNRLGYHWVFRIRRVLISLIILAGYLFYRLLDHQQSLTELGLLSFIGSLHFAPGVIGVLLWDKANRKVVMAGLIAGFGVWALTLFIPVLSNQSPLTLPFIASDLSSEDDLWYLNAALALVVNFALFIAFSLFTKSSYEEQRAAEVCIVENLHRLDRWELSLNSATEFAPRLAETLGKHIADRELDKALGELAIKRNETRPYLLRRLRDQIEANLSGMFGPSVAQEIVGTHLPYREKNKKDSNSDIHAIESRLEEYQHKLSGLAAELDSMRRFHRQTLQDLPMGVCSVNTSNEIIGWNKAMSVLTQISSQEAIGAKLSSLPAPWGNFLMAFVSERATHLHQANLEIKGQSRCLSLHKASVGQDSKTNFDNLVIVIEDLTEIQLLESELTHSERLASIGRLAAGVAHEIGNPITGIACLAQNLRSEALDADTLETSEQILDQTERVTRIVQSLVNFSHAGQNRGGKPEPVNLHQCLSEAIKLIQLSPSGKDYVYENLLPDDLKVMGDAQKLIQVFVNLLSNARDASQPGDKISIHSEHSDLSVSIHIIDEGSGISSDLIDRIFEPFVTSKEPGSGTGLGLALSYSIIEDHYGHISVTSPLDSETGKGTQFTITLPYSPTDETKP